MTQAEALIDLSAIRGNVHRLVAATTAEVMAVVKANGYGHGAVPAARAALSGGATWLGVCTLAEALELRAAGIEAPILSWLHSPGQDWEPALRGGIDISVSDPGLLAEVVAAARAADVRVRLHLKVDTGLSRGGAPIRAWSDLVTAAAKVEAEGIAEIIGIWSHLACADEPGHRSIRAQLDVFDTALALAADQGIRPPLRHIANSAAALNLPEAHYDMVRAGIAMYGYSPLPRALGDFGLRPAMTLRGAVMLVKDLPKGEGVSYGHHYVTPDDTTIAIVPLGYADGIPRAASGRGPLLVGGRRHVIAGRVCMDQFAVDLGQPVGPEPAAGDEATAVRAGDRAVVFGPGDLGEPTADDWAELLDTISYEILTRIGNRVQRVYY